MKKLLIAFMVISWVGASSTISAQNLGFGSATPLNHNATGDDSSDGDAFADIVSDGAGNWVAAWRTTNDLGGILGSDYDIFVQRSSDSGVTWSAPDVLNSNASTDSGEDRIPKIATDGAGNWIVVWYSTENLGGTIGTDFDVLFAVSTDNGATWSAPAALNSSASTDGANQDDEPVIATDGLGNWIVAWSSWDGVNLDIQISKSIDNGATWSAETHIRPDGPIETLYNDSRPKIHVNALGTWMIIWDTWNLVMPDADIFVSRSMDAGATWSTPGYVNNNASTDIGDDNNMRIAYDAIGNWVCIWNSLENLTGSIGSDLDILVARSTDDGLTWSGPEVLNSNAADVDGDDVFSRIATDGAGNYLALWRSTDSFSGAIGTDMDILGSVSTDGGVTWSTAVPLLDHATLDDDIDWLERLFYDNFTGEWFCVTMTGYNLDGTIGEDRDLIMLRTGSLTPPTRVQEWTNF